MRLVQRLKRKVSLLHESVRKHIALAGPGAIALLYHRVTDLAHDPQQLAVTPKNFRAQLQYFKKHYQLLTPEVFLATLALGKPFPQQSLLITFDDGYADNLTEALPILEKENVGAFFFISTGNLDGKREFWWDELEKIVLGKEVLGRPYTPEHIHVELDGKAIFEVTLINDHDRHYFYRDLIKSLKHLSWEEREKVLTQLALIFKIDRNPRPSHLPLHSRELKSLSVSKYATIGAHTSHHTCLPTLSHEDQKQEWQESKRTLEDLIEKPVLTAAYPFGSKTDFTLQSKKICKDVGFEAVFANYPGKIKTRRDTYALPRIMIRNLDITELAVNLPAIKK